ncbi:probable inactive receptor-like protein kinase At3g56050 [Hevea brasiliensis]|uniref:probable inactive receptor-like protein kinase At3g56050 n=1 Tax=Hevea brasiliensis TaxID=3981 RepID=UPI0025F0EBC4|nr:probable inactive receptor-like protein kinase At3g56050 [Hevea brasiliensis]
MLSRINHKNFVNLIGYCEEDESFNRMMIFEYAPNGTLFEYLHVKEMEHLDWSARMRIITGIAYCLQYMHRDLNPPVAHSNLNSHNIFLTDDYAAKAVEYLNDKCSISYLIDPTLKSFKNNELDLICEIIQECIQPDSRQRPTMKDITSKLREVIAISLDQATPRLSPLWWAELEILFVEVT